MNSQKTNVFWIGANIIFDLQTGRTTRVLLIVYREEDASEFKEQDAATYLSFVQTRATDVMWELQPSSQNPQKFVIKGEQNA